MFMFNAVDSAPKRHDALSAAAGLSSMTGRVFAGALFLVSCSPTLQSGSITLDAPRKGYWFLSEKFPYQFMRVELYDNHVEGLPSLTMEFRVKAESTGAIWKADGDQVDVSFKRPVPGTVSLKPVAHTAAYQGRYQSDRLTLPLIEVRLGKERRVMYYTESEEQMDRLLREKQKLRLDVVWGPTGADVIEAMFAFTRPTKDDVMFDLGCGDARILIAAAKRFGTRGVGYDLDPKLIEKGIKTAEQQRVGGLISLKTENLFAADLSSATIVAIYLSDRINAKLKPKFFRELAPGTRVVSHNWHMGDWQPDGRQAMVDRSRMVYYWVMPANFSGVWEGDGGERLLVRQHYQVADIETQAAGKISKTENLRIRGRELVHPYRGRFEIQGETLTVARNQVPPKLFRRRAGTAEPFVL
jgi:SAM-dependent methyltransferase